MRSSAKAACVYNIAGKVSQSQPRNFVLIYLIIFLHNFIDARWWRNEATELHICNRFGEFKIWLNKANVIKQLVHVMDGRACWDWWPQKKPEPYWSNSWCDSYGSLELSNLPCSSITRIQHESEIDSYTCRGLISQRKTWAPREHEFDLQHESDTNMNLWNMKSKCYLDDVTINKNLSTYLTLRWTWTGHTFDTNTNLYRRLNPNISPNLNTNTYPNWT